MLQVSRMYKTYGGWKALVLWESSAPKESGEQTSYWVIHKPHTEDETMVLHDEDGTAHSIFSVNEPPTFGSHHPADIDLTEV